MAAKNPANPANENTYTGVQRAARNITRDATVAPVTYRYDLVKVKATRRGYYGLPVLVDEEDVNSPTGRQTGRQSNALIRNEGEVFDMDALTAFEVVDEEAMSKPRKNAKGEPQMSRKEVLERNGMWDRRVITETGMYILPSWVELAEDEEKAVAPKGHKTKHVPPVLQGTPQE